MEIGMVNCQFLTLKRNRNGTEEINGKKGEKKEKGKEEVRNETLELLRALGQCTTTDK